MVGNGTRLIEEIDVTDWQFKDTTDLSRLFYDMYNLKNII
jgi:hypothetical protein